MSNQNKEKSVDRSTEWTEWIEDSRGFWFRERNGPNGAKEYDYDYPVQDNDIIPQQRPRPLSSLDHESPENFFIHRDLGSKYAEKGPVGTPDIRYKTIPNHRLDKFWRIGRVFLTLRAEPARQDQQIPRPQYSSPGGYLGGVAYWEIRRLMVIGKSHGNALCSPIHTYGGQACLKPGLSDVHKHAIIYTSETAPHEQRYEADDGTIVVEGLTMNPIRVVSEQSGKEGDLGNLSRINFSKVYTVEFYAHVLNVGMVHPHMLETVIHYSQKAREEPSQGPIRRHHSKSKKSHPESTKHGSKGTEKRALNSLESVSKPSKTSHEDTTASVRTSKFFNSDGILLSERPVTESSISIVEAPLSGDTGSVAPVDSPMYDYKRQPQKSTSSLRAVSDSRSESSQPDDHLVKIPFTEEEDPKRLLPVIAGSINNNNNFIRVEEEVTMGVNDSQTREPSSRRRTDSASSSTSSGLADSVFSTSTYGSQSSLSSSYTSVYELHSRPLLAFFSEAASLKSLFLEALYSISADKLERILQKCLRQFARHLKTETLTSAAFIPRLSEFIGASKVIQQLSRSTAYRIREKAQEQYAQQVANPTTQELKTGHEVGRSPVTIPDGEADLEDEEDDDEEDENNADDGENVHELEEISTTLEALILRTHAFQMFQDNFRLYLSPNMYKRALFDAWPIIQPQSATVSLEYGLVWELPKFLNSNRIEPKDFRRFITLTGENEAVQALSCEDYIISTWPKVGPSLLNVLERFLDGYFYDENRNDNTTDGLTIKLQCKLNGLANDPSQIHVAVKADYASHLELLSAFSWLCASFRPSTGMDVSHSTVSVKALEKSTATASRPLEARRANKSILISVDNLKRCSVVSCWHALFPYCVIAKGFPIASRIDGRGLEISFADMALVTRCLGFVPYQDGLIAHGLTSIVIPMQELIKDDALQWHFEDKTKQENGNILGISQVLRKRQIRDWYQESSPELLIRRRCFLGWAGKANIVIGTRDYQAETTKFDCSGAPRSPKTYSKKTTAFSFSVSAMSYVTIQGTRETTRVGMMSSVNQSRLKDLLSTIQTSHKKVVLLYDNASKIAYYVPQASVVLHIAHTIIAQRKYTLLDNEEPLDIAKNPSVFASMDPDGATAACLALRACMKLMVDQGDDEEHSSFADIIEMTWHTLNNIETHLDTADTDFQLAGLVAPRYLHGIELEDAANWEQNMPIKQAQVDQPWAHLSSETAVVLFCRDILEPITADCPSLCKSWASVPRGENYLVAMGNTVKILLERQVDGLAHRLDWHDQKELVQSHDHTVSKAVQHIQKLRSLKRPHSNAATRQSIEKHLQGCLVFGNEKNLKVCHAMPNSAKLSAINDTHTNSLEQSVTFVRVPSSTSATSVETSIRTSCISSSPSTSSGEDACSMHLSQTLTKTACLMSPVSENLSEIATSIGVGSGCPEISKIAHSPLATRVFTRDQGKPKTETTAQLRFAYDLEGSDLSGRGKKFKGKRKHVVAWIRGELQEGTE